MACFLPSPEVGAVDHIPDFSNTPSCPVTECLQIPADATPAEAAAGIISYFKEVGWPNGQLKRLAQYIIKQCADSATEVKQSILESTREVVVSYFAKRLATDQTTLLTSGQVHQSFVKALGSENEYANLSHKLNRDQALCVANSILGKTQASNLEYDTCSRGGSVENFSFKVIEKICQMKGRYYTIQAFLDELKDPDFST